MHRNTGAEFLDWMEKVEMTPDLALILEANPAQGVDHLSRRNIRQAAHAIAGDGEGTASITFFAGFLSVCFSTGMISPFSVANCT